MNKEQIIDKVYEKYSIIAGMSTQVVSLTKDSFIHCIKTDFKFSETWGLKIDERELSQEERVDIFNKKKEYGEVILPEFKSVGDMNAWTNKLLEEVIPTRLITLTYNNETIESYE